MADKKISALTASTTPLAGTEVLPIVQGSATVKVSVANLTAGRAVSASSLTASTDNVIIGTTAKGITTGSAIPLGFGTNNAVTSMTLDTSGNLLIGNTTQILFVNKELNVNAASGASGFVLATANSARLYMTGSSTDGNITTKGAIPLLFGTNEAERMRIGATGDVTIATGNLVFGTANKGIVDSTGTTTLQFTAFQVVSNKQIIAPSVATATGSTASTPTATPVTLFTPSGDGVWIVNALVTLTGAPAAYIASSMIKASGGVLAATAISTATNMSISVSGANVQATQTSGGDQIIAFSYIRLF
jgi:hypothetical protein